MFTLIGLATWAWVTIAGVSTAAVGTGAALGVRAVKKNKMAQHRANMIAEFSRGGKPALTHYLLANGLAKSDLDAQSMVEDFAAQFKERAAEAATAAAAARAA